MVVFCTAAGLATYLMRPSWVTQRRLAEGNITDDDAENMRVNLVGYIHMTGQAMVMAAEAGDLDTVDELSSFMLETLETVNPVERVNNAMNAGWQHLATLDSLTDLEHKRRLLNHIGAASDVRIRTLCVAFEATAEHPEGRALAPDVLATLRAGLQYGPHQADFARRSCRSALTTTLRGWLTLDPILDTESLVVYADGLRNFANGPLLYETLQDSRISAVHVLRFLDIVANSERAADLPLSEADLILFIVRRPMVHRAEWWGEQTEGGAPAFQLLDRLAPQVGAVALHEAVGRVGLAAPTSLHEEAAERQAQVSATVLELLREAAIEGVLQCTSLDPEFPVSEVNVQLLPGEGAELSNTGSDVIDECLAGLLAEVGLPGQQLIEESRQVTLPLPQEPTPLHEPPAGDQPEPEPAPE